MVQGLRQSVSELTALHGEVQRSVDRMTATLTEQLKTTSQQFTDLLQTASNNITYHLKSTSSEVAQQVERSGVEVSQQIQISGDTLTQRLLSTSGDFVQNVARARSELFNYMEESSTAMTTRLEETTNQLFGKIEQASGSLTTQLVGATQRVGEHLDQASTQMTSRLDDTTSRLFQHIDRSNSDIFARLETASNEVSHKLEQAGNSMFVRIDTTARNLGERFDIATELLERVTTDITGRMEVTSLAFSETLENKFGSLASKLAGSRDQFDGIVEDATGKIMAELGQVSSAFAAGLGERTSEITGRFDTMTNSLVVKLNSSGGALMTALDEATRSLNANTETSAAKIEEAGTKFARHVETTNQFFAEQLSVSATTLDERLEAISTQLTGKLELTGTKLSERLEDVSLLVDKSVDRFNSDIEKILHNREDVLGDLAGRLGRKAEDVDNMMRNYMTLIEESLDKADSRSREIGKLIASQADTASQNLEQQIKQLEDTTDAQIASAARQLREQYERAVNTMNEMLSMTAGEFTQTAQDMRVTAQQVVRDIDSARNELRQAILDLPDETRTNSEAMRKVVSDQIEALNTLADVVRRQSSGLDGGAEVLLRRRESGAGNSAGAASEAAPEWKAGRSGETSGPTVRGRPVSALLETETPKGSGDLLPQLRSEIAAAGPARGRKKTDANSISRETEALVTKLNGSTRDLVEAIDGKLPSDLERRFDRGEHHVYTHRLYQGRGEKMLDLLTERYQNERLIRSRIDAVVTLFERLLDTVAATAQGEQLVDACLASESGKLYLMLAHASGRVEALKQQQA